MKLSELIAEEVTNAFYAHEGEFPDQLEHKTAAAITARLHECVKPLEWVDNTKQGFFCKTPYGTYGALKMHGAEKYLACLNGVTFDHLHHADADIAKAAAQDHYAKQIIEGFNL